MSQIEQKLKWRADLNRRTVYSPEHDKQIFEHFRLCAAATRQSRSMHSESAAFRPVSSPGANCHTLSAITCKQQERTQKVSGFRWFFGFGSLVNDGTLPPGTTWKTATLRGMRRTWGHGIPSDPPWFALNVQDDPTSEIDGLLIQETPTLAPILAQRESGYSARILSPEALSESLPPGDSAWVWTSDSPALHGSDGCLLQSYVDCVFAGFLSHFGQEGIHRFVASTEGWQHPIIADRGAPRYPRACSLPGVTLRLIDKAVDGAQRAARSALGSGSDG